MQQLNYPQWYLSPNEQIRKECVNIILYVSEDTGKYLYVYLRTKVNFADKKK